MKDTLGALSLSAAQQLSAKLCMRGVRDIRCCDAVVYDLESYTGLKNVTGLRHIHVSECIKSLFDSQLQEEYLYRMTDKLAEKITGTKLVFCKIPEPLPGTGASAEHGISAGVVVRALVCYDALAMTPELVLTVCVGEISADVIN